MMVDRVTYYRNRVVYNKWYEDNNVIINRQDYQNGKSVVDIVMLSTDYIKVELPINNRSYMREVYGRRRFTSN